MSTHVSSSSSIAIGWTTTSTSQGEWSFCKSRGAARLIATAPNGAEIRIANTAIITTFSPKTMASGSTFKDLAVSSASEPTAACTVALGSQAMATNSRSFQFKSAPQLTANPVKSIRTTSAMTNTTSASPTIAGSRAALVRSTSAPIRPNKTGWHNVQARSSTSAALTRSPSQPAWRHRWLATKAAVSAPSAPEPGNPTVFEPKTAIKPAHTRKKDLPLLILI